MKNDRREGTRPSKEVPPTPFILSSLGKARNDTGTPPPLKLLLIPLHLQLLLLLHQQPLPNLNRLTKVLLHPLNLNELLLLATPPLQWRKSTRARFTIPKYVHLPQRASVMIPLCVTSNIPHHLFHYLNFLFPPIPGYAIAYFKCCFLYHFYPIKSLSTYCLYSKVLKTLYFESIKYLTYHSCRTANYIQIIHVCLGSSSV